ncbi:MAG TPA: PAS domain S-box protein [Planctomycetota bacterium]|nr:PAS domain S-box protein [Planctomycetota bacterium]
MPLPTRLAATLAALLGIDRLAAGEADMGDAGSWPWLTLGCAVIAGGALATAALAARALTRRTRQLESSNAELARALAQREEALAHRARQESALSASEQRFRLAAKNASNLIYDWDLATGLVDWSGPIDEVLGHPPGGFPRTEAAWNAAIVDEDRERIIAADRAHIASREPYREEYRVRRADGTVLTWSDHGTVVYDERGRAVRWIGAIADVTAARAAERERLRAGEALAASELRFRTLYESSMAGFIVWDLDGGIVDANDEFLRMVGYDREDLAAGRVRWLEMTPPEWHQVELNKLAELNARGSIEPFEKEYVRKDRTRIPILIGGAFIDAGRRRGVSWVHDLSAQRRAEAALAESEGRNRALLELSPTAILILSGGSIAFANDAAARLLGANTPGDLVGKPALDFVHPDFREVVRDRQRRLMAGEPVPAIEEKLVRLDGGVVDAEVRASPFTWRGRPAAYVVAVDLGAGRRGDEALRASEKRFRQLAESIDAVFWITSADRGRTFYVSPAWQRVYGSAVQTAYDDPLAWYHAIHPEDRARIDLRADAAAAPLDIRYRIIRADGALRWLRTRVQAERGADGAVHRLVGLTEDVTGLEQAEALRAREQDERDRLVDRLQLQLDAMPIACLRSDAALIVTYANPAAASILGIAVDDLVGHPLRAAIAADDAAAVDRALAQVAAGATPPAQLLAGTNRHGRTVAAEWHHLPLGHPAGGFAGAMSMAIDAGERQRLEEQLRQAQKMEAVGQLAGGVAHDFNNLLTVITGYGEMHLQNLAKGDPRRRGVEQMLKASKRASALTQQLLAFSRRQALQPRVIDLNALIGDLDAILRRAIGERVEVVIRPQPGLGRVRADPGQLEQVVMNLCINARDAMPDGGHLTIETANVELDEIYTRLHPTVKPGSTVMLAVSDTGIGMDPETQARIFEPFFTTKEPGKGTGLGLATVYGIVKQSGGNIWFSSEPGRGTVFKIYLPRVGDSPGIESQAPDAEQVRAGAETILLVEDEADVRDLIREMLSAEGYRVIEAGNGSEALAAAEKAGHRIDLMMTDVVMPKMSGPELAERLGKSVGGLRVLYMSGYMDKIIVDKGVIDRDFIFLEKPFTSASMLRKVREALDRGAPA